MDRVENIVANGEAISATWNGIQDQAASVLQNRGWRGRRPTLECDGTNVTVGDHDGFSVGTTQADATFVPAHGSQNATLGTLANDTWYCLYAFDDDGDTGLEVFEYDVSGAPDGSLSHKNDDASRLYVGCFVTNGSAAPRPFLMVNGRYTYRQSDASGTPFKLGPYTSSGSPHTLDLSPFLPPHALLARLRVLTNATGSATVVLQKLGASGGTYDYSSIAPTAGTQLVETLEIETDASQRVGLGVSNAGVTVEVQGFYEK